MPNNSRTNHIEVNVNKTLKQMFVCFYRRRVIAIFPVGTFSTLPLIEFLAGPARYQLNGFGYRVSMELSLTRRWTWLEVTA